MPLPRPLKYGSQKVWLQISCFLFRPPPPSGRWVVLLFDFLLQFYSIRQNVQTVMRLLFEDFDVVEFFAINTRLPVFTSKSFTSARKLPLVRARPDYHCIKSLILILVSLRLLDPDIIDSR